MYFSKRYDDDDLSITIGFVSNVICLVTSLSKRSSWISAKALICSPPSVFPEPARLPYNTATTILLNTMTFDWCDKILHVPLTLPLNYPITVDGNVCSRSELCFIRVLQLLHLLHSNGSIVMHRGVIYARHIDMQRGVIYGRCRGKQQKLRRVGRKSLIPERGKYTYSMVLPLWMARAFLRCWGIQIALPRIGVEHL
jgi:hypothetical protein